MPRLSAPMTTATPITSNSNQSPTANRKPHCPKNGQPLAKTANRKPQTVNHNPSSFILKPLALSPDPLIQLVLILAIGVTPLLFSPAFSELFEFPKMVFVYALAVISIPLIAAKSLRRQHLNLPRTPLDLTLGLYLMVFLAATALSIDLYSSILGYYTRFTGGLASVVAYLILFYLAIVHLGKSRNDISKESQNLKSKGPASSPSSGGQANNIKIQNSKYIGNNISNLVGSSDFDYLNFEAKVQPLLFTWICSATIVSIYAILEHFGHDPSCLVLRGSFTANCWVQDVSARAFATFGQPNWLACYLITALPIAFVQLLFANSRSQRVSISAAIILMYAAWWFTYSRAGWFGLAAAAIVLALSISWQLIKANKWWLIGISLACLLITATNFNLAASRIGTSLESGDDDSSTGQIRLLVWQGSLNLIAHHPLLGTGPETFAYSFLPYRPRAMNDTTEWNFLYNKAHNEILQTAATTGLLGLVTWLGLFVAAGFYLWKNGIFDNLRRLRVFSLQFSVFSHKTANRKLQTANHDPYPLLQSALFAGLIGVFIAQLLGFAVVITSLFFWLALAFIVAPFAQTHSIRFPSVRIPIFSLLTLAVIVCFLIASYGLYRYAGAELLTAAAQSGNPAQSVIKNQQAVNLNPLEPNYHKNLALAYESLSALDQGANRQWTKAADQQAQTAYQLNPHDQIIIKQLAYMYQQLALMDSAYQPKALQMAKSAWDLAPTDASAAENLADLQLQYNLKDAALQTYDQLVKLRPASESYLHRAQWFQKFGTPDQYRAALEQVLKVDPQNKDAQNALGLLQTKTLPGNE